MLGLVCISLIEGISNTLLSFPLLRVFGRANNLFMLTFIADFMKLSLYRERLLNLACFKA